MRRVDLRPKNERSVNNKSVWYYFNGKVVDAPIDIPGYATEEDIILVVTGSDFNGATAQWRLAIRKELHKRLKIGEIKYAMRSSQTINAG